MDDLRSLEGVGHLLNEKMRQNGNFNKRTRKRSISGPTLSNGTSSITSQTIAISEQFTPQLAAALASGINAAALASGTKEPSLLKSHSSFVRLDDNKSSAQCPPMLSRQCSLTPRTVHDSSLQNIEQSPTICLKLQLDSTDVVIGDVLINSVWNTPISLDKNMTTIPSPNAIDYENNHTPDLLLKFSYDHTATAVTPTSPQLIKTYSNSLFTLCDDQKLNKNVAADVELMNLQEDFMEYPQDKVIGLGASGIVRKAFHFRSCSMVAIKQCRLKRDEEINAFIKEANIYREFEHNPNIVDIFGFGKDSDNDTLTMAMQYMDLGSCDSLKISTMKQKELTVGHIIVNILKAMVDLHDNLYVHNDIKPANILCNKYGEIKLSDFGTMQQLKDKDDKLHKNNGTQRYQSPEKIWSRPIAYDTKTDIWSLGVTAYELLFGEVKDELAFVHHPPKLSPKEHAISRECCDFIMKCLKINDEERESASDLMKHQWFIEMESIPLSTAKWPWFITIDRVKNNEIKRHEFHNEDLLFMISALVIFYSTQSLDLKKDENNGSASLHRRISGVESYTDQQRIENIAKYALCSTKMVVERIKVTVAFIKAQINKLVKL